MKNIGIIRKIDELGRIVIPKEIRKVLKIKSNDSLEIKVCDGILHIEKYSPLDNSKKYTNDILNTIVDTSDGNIFITDREKVITKGILENKRINNFLLHIIEDRKLYFSKNKESIDIDGVTISGFFILLPIIVDSDVIGLIVMNKNTNIDERDILLIKILKKIIENYQTI